MPITKKSETEVSWSEGEMSELMNVIKTSEGAGEKRDSTSYSLEYSNTSFTIDWEKLPSKYQQTFEQLKDDLQIVKR